MSQQGESRRGQEDDWWRQLYDEEAAGGAAPAAPESIDAHFDSALSAMSPPPPPPSAADTLRLRRPTAPLPPPSWPRPTRTPPPPGRVQPVSPPPPRVERDTPTEAPVREADPSPERPPEPDRSAGPRPQAQAPYGGERRPQPDPAEAGVPYADESRLGADAEEAGAPYGGGSPPEAEPMEPEPPYGGESRPGAEAGVPSADVSPSGTDRAEPGALYGAGGRPGADPAEPGTSYAEVGPSEADAGQAGASYADASPSEAAVPYTVGTGQEREEAAEEPRDAGPAPGGTPPEAAASDGQDIRGAGESPAPPPWDAWSARPMFPAAEAEEDEAQDAEPVPPWDAWSAQPAFPERAEPTDRPDVPPTRQPWGDSPPAPAEPWASVPPPPPAGWPVPRSTHRPDDVRPASDAPGVTLRPAEPWTSPALQAPDAADDAPGTYADDPDPSASVPGGQAAPPGHDAPPPPPAGRPYAGGGDDAGAPRVPWPPVDAAGRDAPPSDQPLPASDTSGRDSGTPRPPWPPASASGRDAEGAPAAGDETSASGGLPAPYGAYGASREASGRGLGDRPVSWPPAARAPGDDPRVPPAADAVPGAREQGGVPAPRGAEGWGETSFGEGGVRWAPELPPGWVAAEEGREPVAEVVGGGAPTYAAEPSAWPEADPDGLDGLVADTVLDGAEYGGLTVRTVSLRGDSARYRGQPRRDALLTARFGTGDDALLLVAMASGARAADDAHRAAQDSVRWIAGAVGRSRERLAQDLRAARRGSLKSGLHRLTDRCYGRLRARGEDLGLDEGTYTASLRCLLLPADPACPVRLFFGVGDGGLFRIRSGGWQDLDLAPDGTAAPFRFRATVAQPGDALVMCSAGLAEPLRGEPALAAHLAERWGGGRVPGLAAYLADTQTRVKGYADDRTAVTVWDA
ncbi:protein phosphatase 2C domain-containing protein [Streptomyces sp. NBC_00433]